MAELTAEIVRTIVKEEVTGQISGLHTEMSGELSNLHTEMNDGFANLRTETSDGFANLRNEMNGGFGNVRGEMSTGFSKINRRLDELTNDAADGFQRVLDTMQDLHDEHRDELAGINDRLHDHDVRLARLERPGSQR